jgi:allophanate hydrolase subunit 2
LPGPEYQEFDEVSQESFWRSPWQISPQSNRMGYRLQGQPLTGRPTGNAVPRFVAWRHSGAGQTVNPLC